MRNYRRYASRKGRGSGGQDFWLSFSDLMSVLVLVFILVMFYILYKYFIIHAAYEKELNNMLVIQAALDEKETELTAAQSQLLTRENELTAAQDELTAAQDELTTAQGELTAAQEELAAQQLMLELAQKAVDDSEAELTLKQDELDEAIALIAQREMELDQMGLTLSAQQEKLDTQQAQLEALVGVRSRIIMEMSASLRENSISATVDPDTGAIILASDVMFEYGSSKLSDDGKAFIDDFLPVYLSVLFSEENEGYVSEIIIEGHTDTVDTYIKNLSLSQDRAHAVAEYVLSSKFKGLTNAEKQRFQKLLTANGRSFSDPIYDSRGRVDAAASRRVVFKFRLTDDEMIRQMQQILEGGGE